MTGHDLAIQVYSEGVAGRGAQFFIDFPVMPPAEAPQALSQQCRDDAGREVSVERLTLLTRHLRSIFRKNATVALHNDGTAPFSSTSNNPSDDLVGTDAQTACDNSMHVESFREDSSKVAPPRLMKGASLAKLVTMPLPRHLSDMSILIVDDSVINRRMVRRTLQQHYIGASYEEACDGLELLLLLGVSLPTGVDVSEQHVLDIPAEESGDTLSVLRPPSIERPDAPSYDVILLDDKMLQMDGSVAVRLLREHGYTGLVVGVTGIAVEEEMQLFCEAGVDYALPKPFVVQDLMRVLQTHFEIDGDE
jgi:CheY-like chemotaxis protein